MLKKLFSLKMPKGISKILFITLFFMALFGAIMVTSASMNTFTTTRDIISTLIRQGVFLFISTMMLIKFSQLFSFNFMKKYEWLLIIGTLLVLLSTRLFETSSNAYNWIYIGPFTLQPSEFAKVVIMILIANNLGSLPETEWMKKTKVSLVESIKRLWSMMWGPIIAVIVFIVIVFSYQKDLGSAVVMVFITLFMMFCAQHPFLGKPQRLILILLLIAAIGVVWIVSPSGAAFLDSSSLSDNYMIQRITSIYYLFRPENITGSSLQQVKGLFSFAYGGLSGVGYGQSIQKYGYLPAASTDYILAIVVEELGIWGFILIAIGYIILIGTLLMYAIRVSSSRGRLFLIGVATYLFIHFLFNVGGVTVILPLTGIPLLLISQGGSSQMALFIAFGIAQNIIARDNNSRQKRGQKMS